MTDSREAAAERAEEIGELETALRIWTQIGSEKKNPVFLACAGRVAMELERWADSEALFEWALRLEEMPQIMASFGLLLQKRTDCDRSGNLETAVRCYLRSLEAIPDASCFTLLGTTYMQMGDTESAEAALLEALALDDHYDEAYLNLGLLYVERDVEKARRLFQLTLSLDPERLTAHQELGLIFQRERDYPQAEYHFSRCVEINPGHFFSRLYLANYFGTQQRNAEAEQQYRFAMELQPEDPGAYSFFANFLESIGRREEADALRIRADALKASQAFESK